MRNAVGVIDGTPVVFSQRPGVDGEVFWSRKCEYSYNLQLVCDDRKKIRYFISGWPGSVFDNSVFETSKLYKKHVDFFSPGEFLLADAGYALQPFVCVPYKNPAARVAHNRVFNELFSSCRTIIEHTNGMLKSRFSSLKGIRTQIKNRSDFGVVQKHIIVCLILHNLLIDFDDEWEDIEEEEDDEKENLDQNLMIATGHQLRTTVQNFLLTWFFETGGRY